jgi:hypothetical protein
MYCIHHPLLLRSSNPLKICLQVNLGESNHDSTAATNGSETTDTNNNNNSNAPSSINFSQVECLLYTLLQLSSKAPGEFKILSGNAASTSDTPEQQQQVKENFKEFHSR